MIYTKNVTLLQSLVYPLSFDTIIQDILAMHGRAGTISNGDVKIDLRKIGG